MPVTLVGILNITPDSFSDGGQWNTPETSIAHAAALFADGAKIVDVGAESTRPGATPLTAAEEWQRLAPVLPALIRDYPGQISLDTYHPETVKKALALGPCIINDVTGLKNLEMIAVVVAAKQPVIISHLPGNDIQAAHQSQGIDDINQVRDELLARAEKLISQGFSKSDIILDPGIGFGKTMRLNRELLEFARKVPEYPVMIGYSRKRFLGEHRMELDVNLAAGKIAIDAGADYLRVHDVAGHRSLVA